MSQAEQQAYEVLLAEAEARTQKWGREDGMKLLPTFASQGDLAPLLNKIHHCDALELLRRLPDQSISMVLCDLPYGVTACAWDEIIPLAPMWEGFKRVAKKRAAIVLTATQPFTSKLISSNYEMFRHSWVWEKSRHSNFANAKYAPLKLTEDILVFGIHAVKYYPEMIHGEMYKTRVNSQRKGTSIYGETLHNKGQSETRDLYYPTNVLKFSSPMQQNLIHPTQKPVALFEYLIKTYTQAGDVVLDMCVGSGTTAIAARNLGRSFICGDSYLPYVEMARTRLQNTDPFQATVFKTGEKQLSLFEGISA